MGTAHIQLISICFLDNVIYICKYGLSLQVFLVTTTRRYFVIVMYLGDQDHHNLSLICLTSKHVGTVLGGFFFIKKAMFGIG